MTQPRKRLIDLESTSYYHCIARCVRRAFLCGECHLTGANYEHRKAWVTERLSLLSRVFSIDVAAYAVMSNHYHLVLRVNKTQADDWNDETVISKWKQLFCIPSLIKQANQPNASLAVKSKANELIEEWRERLCDISWFMRCLNEHLARKANAEDNCTGRFWEGRFKSQALLDDAAVLTAMAYVDLNPIRAKIAKTPEKSDYTSIQQRIQSILKKPNTHKIKLMTLSAKPNQHKHSVCFSNKDYLELVDWSGRIIRKDKRGAIDNHIPPILERLNLQHKEFIKLLKRKDDIAGLKVFGSPIHLTQFVEHSEQAFVKGISLSKALFQT